MSANKLYNQVPGSAQIVTTTQQQAKTQQRNLNPLDSSIHKRKRR